MRLFRFLRKNKQNWNPTADRSFRYGTHVPVLQAMLDVFQPSGILELGVGRNSTPLFHEYGKRLVSVETNRQWIDEIGKTFPQRANFSLIHHELTSITERTRAHTIPERVKSECVKYYLAIKAMNPELNLLFIDHVSGLRAATLISLHQHFDHVVYHDADKAGYRYDLFTQQDTGSHLHFVLRSFVPCTGLLIRKNLAGKLPELERALEKYGKEYLARLYRFDLQDLTKAA
jgi:hypothetical protein